jgi:hypothetical protein
MKHSAAVPPNGGRAEGGASSDEPFSAPSLPAFAVIFQVKLSE